MLRIITLVTIITLASLTVVSQSQDNSEPLLRYLTTLSMENDLLHRTQLSSDGQYIAAIGFSLESVEQRQRPTYTYVWRLIRNNDTFNLLLLGSIPMGEDDFDANIAFSPDVGFLSLRIAGELRLYNLPNLELLDTIPIEQPPFLVGSPLPLAWAKNEHLILTGAHLGESLVLWDIEQRSTITHSMNYEPQTNQFLYSLPEIIAIEDGWIISTFGDSALVFVACTLNIEECQSYETDASLIYNVDTSQDGQYIFATVSGNDNDMLWEREANNHYELLTDKLRADNISSQGNYLFLQCVSNTESQIIEFPSLNVVQTIEYPYCRATFNPMWLASDSFFVLFSPAFGLGLYQLGQAEAIQVLELPNLPANAVLEPDRVEIPMMDAEENLIVVNNGGVVHIIEIENSAR